MDAIPPASPAPPAPAGLPPRRRSLWVKAGIGCGSALLLLLLGLGGITFWALRRGARIVDQAWAEAERDVAALRTEEGARTLYRAHPRLAQTYPSEREFLEAAARWRTRLGDLPPRPDLRIVITHEEPMELRITKGQGEPVIDLRLRLSSGANLFLELEDGTLSDLRVE